MNEQDLRGLVADVRRGRLSRRSFVQRMVALGLSAPMAGMMLAHGRRPAAATADAGYKPTKAGGGGPLKLLFWQGPTLLNGHFSTGTKDVEGSRIFYEPLAGWDSDGNLVPVLATAIPSVENGGLAADGKSVTWTLKPGVKWHDGKPFTADDLVFTWEFVRDPAAACVTIATYSDIKVTKLDDLTVRVDFAGPTPFWADAFVGRNGMILPKHVYADYMGCEVARGARQPHADRHGALSAASSSARPTPCGASASPTTTGRTGPISTRSSSRAAATPCRRPAPCCRRATTTMPGTCRSRTRC